MRLGLGLGLELGLRLGPGLELGDCGYALDRGWGWAWDLSRV